MHNTLKTIEVLPPKRVFPIIRHLSYQTTKIILRFPLRANHVTVLGTLIGLVGAWSFAEGERENYIIGSILFIISSILDNCDGEIARYKIQITRLGDYLGDFGAWLVHVTTFLGMGIGQTSQTDNDLWFWLSLIAAIGATINYLLSSILFKVKASERINSPADLPEQETWTDHLLYIFRALFRADFCILLLIFVLSNQISLLLVGAAIGAQVYWGTALYEKARRFHV